MENASKALIFIGGVLIAILLISLGLAFVNNIQEQSSVYYEILSIEEINKINNELTKDIVQIDSKKYITAQGIVTLKAEIEKLKKYDNIIVTLIGGNITLDQYGVNSNSNSIDKINYFQVTGIEYNDTNGIISKVEYSNTPHYMDKDGKIN